MKAEVRIFAASQRSPASVELARYLSLASRISPGLMRRFRLRFLPSADPGLEAELWLSPLVEIRSAKSILLYPRVAAQLRRQFLEEPEKLKAARKLLVQTRPYRPELVRLEEDLIWMGLELVRDGRSKAAAEKLRQVIKAILEEERRGLSRWVLGALRRLPELEGLRDAALLEVVAASRLADDWVTLDPQSGATLTVAERALLRSRWQRVEVGIRLAGSTLEIHEPPRVGDEIVDVPATRPRRHLTVSWSVDGAEREAVLSWAPGRSSNPLQVIPPVVLVSLAEDRYELESQSMVVEGLVELVKPFVVRFEGLYRQEGVGWLASERLILTSTCSLPEEVRGNVRGLADPAATEKVGLRFPFLDAKTRREARIVGYEGWPRNLSASDNDGIVLLEIVGEAPEGARPAEVVEGAELRKACGTVGFQSGETDAVWERFRIQRSEGSEPGALALKPTRHWEWYELGTWRWCGAPLVERGSGRVVGLTAAVSNRMACVPWTELRGSFPRLKLPNGRASSHTASGRFAAFISYANRYADWVKTLQQNLELCLDREVFLDRTDLDSGQSWVRQLQAGISKAEHFVLVVTPEAMASPRVTDEWQSFVTKHRDWSVGRLHVVMLVDCPLPHFLEQIQRVDFTRSGEASYRGALQKLVAGLLELPGRQVPELPPDLQALSPPIPDLPRKLRGSLVDALAPFFQEELHCWALAPALGLDRKALDGHPSAALAASAALVLTKGDDDAITAAKRVLEVLVNEMARSAPERVEQLRALRIELEESQPKGARQGLLGAYLHKVTLDHQRLVRYFQDNDDIDLLDRVYVQLELQSQRGLRRPQEMALAKTTFEMQEVLDLDPEEHPWVTRRWVLRGEPGAGKTTLLRHFAASAAGEERRSWVPVFDSIPRMLRDREWLIHRLERQLAQVGEPSEGLSAALEHEAQQGRLLLLLDGLDEVSREGRGEAVALLRQLSVRWPDTPLIVTSRPIGYERPDESFVELDLLPLDAERRQRFLARWFGRKTGVPDPDRAKIAMAQLELDSNLCELAGNPLYLTLMALLIEQGTKPSRRRAKLYDQVFGLLLKGSHRKGKELECADVAREVLRHLAYAMTLENLDAEPLEKLERRIYEPALDAQREILERVPRWRRRMLDFLKDIGERTGILGAHDGPEMPWKFLHRTFREALAAEQLEQMYLRDGAAAVLKVAQEIAGDESRWAEPYALLAGRVEDPDSLVTALVEANRALGLRAMAMAQGLKRETLEGILELSDKWEERIKVYPRIPELIGDADAALSLLDNLRQGTRNGNDLFFLDLALAEVGKQSPDHLQRTEQLRRRLFDHIPAPSEDLFLRIETARDGEVDLWREIPAGSFLMGSSPTEEGHASDEAPQHEVEMVAPFWLSAVAVTQEQYAAFDPEHRSLFDGDQRPVEQVTWYAAVSFCRWLSTLADFAGARLPREDEWEYACRAGTTTRFWAGDGEEALERVAWISKNSGKETHRVGEKPANPWGLYDVHGNVWEWTVSEWSDDYSDRQASAKTDPLAGDAADFAVSTAAAVRVFRGGSCWDLAQDARSAYRGWVVPGVSLWSLGFRVLLPSSPRL